MLPGVGPAVAQRALDHVRAASGRIAALDHFDPPPAARELWPRFAGLMARLVDPGTAWGGQVHLVRDLYDPLMAQLYDAAHVRIGDIEQLEQIAGEYPSRERFLTELTLDPPEASGDQDGPPLLDEDYLILSTIHSAKGQEWDVVYVLHCADGCIPSDMSTGKPEQIEEERRLLYVAMTRARVELHLVHPLRMFIRQQHRHGDRHVYTPLTRFIPESIAGCFERTARARTTASDHAVRNTGVVDVGAKLRDMW